MARTETVIINVDTTDSQKSIDKLKDSIDSLGKSGGKSAKEASKSVDDIGKSGKSAEKGLGGVGTAFKGIGTAIKAAGIGLVVSLFASLTVILMKNQKVMDALESVMTTLALGFNALVTAVSDAYTRVNELTGGFDATKAVIKGLITLGLTPLKILFYELKAALLGFQLLWETSMFGDKDPVKVIELTTALSTVKDELITIGKEALTAGKSIVKNFGEAGGEIGAFGTAAVKGIGDISISSLKKQADGIVALKNAAEIGMAQNEKIIQQYDRQAEKQRQIRDDVNKSITERIKANNELNKILDLSSEKQLENANLAISAAKAELSINNSKENKIKLIQAEAAQLAVLADIEGKRSEQLTNQTALQLEQNELNKIGAEGDASRAIAQRAADAELIKNEQKRLEQKKKNLEEDKKIELDRLQAVIDANGEGTLLRAQAEQERLNAIQAFAITEDALNEEIRVERYNRDLEQAAIDVENQWLSFEEKRAALIEQERLLLEDKALTDEQRYVIQRDTNQKLIDLDKERVAEKQQMLDDLISIAGAETNVGKALLIAKQLLMAKEMVLEISRTITFSTQAAARSMVAVAEGKAQTAKIGFPKNIPMLIGYAAQAAGIIAAIRGAVKSAKGSSNVSDIGNIGSTSAVKQLAPTFNVVGTSSENQLAQSLSAQSNKPIRTYVVSTEMTSQQEMDRAIRAEATFGG